jgi:hypothetical protein
MHEGGAWFVRTGSGITGTDGAFRICDLYPGTWRLQASLSKGDLSFGTANIPIGDEDMKGLKITALPGVPMEAEVVLDGQVPETPLPTEVRLSLIPLLRTTLEGERPNGASPQIPGKIELPAVITDDYSVRTSINGPGLYLKDVTYSGHSVRYEPLRIGTAPPDAGLRVIVGRDGATLNAQVTNKDGIPVADVRIVALPDAITSEGMLAASMLTGQADQNGKYTSQSLAPGKYYVAAIDGEINHSSETIARLWRSRSRFTEVDLAPNGSTGVTLQPMPMVQ